MITIIAQSHSIARTISYILAADNEEKGYYANDKYAVTWTYGHMVEIKTPYGQPGYWFRDTSFPVIPTSFPLAAAPSPNSEEVKGEDPQLSVIRNLLSKSDEVLMATDPSIQGQKMAEYLISYLNYKGKVTRIVLNDLMSKTINNAIYRPENAECMTRIGKVATLKDKLDWIVNVNASRSFAFATGMKTYPVSRTATPILSLLAERDNAIKNFEAKKSVVPTISVKDNNGNLYTFSCDEEWDAIPMDRLNELKAGVKALVCSYEVQKYSEAHPKLHSLATLQVEAAEVFGMSPAETYKIARQLYEHKRISFPGISRNGITRRKYEEIKETLEKMQEVTIFKNIAPEGFKPSFSNAGKSDGSETHGLILTGYPLIYLSSDEAKIIFLIGRRMMTTFSQSHYGTKTKVTLRCADMTFTSQFVQVIRPGFMQLAHYPPVNTVEAPDFNGINCVEVVSCGMVGKKTSCPTPYTDSTLLAQIFSERKMPELSETVAKDLGYLISKGYVTRNRLGEYSLSESGRALCYIMRGMTLADFSEVINWEEVVEKCVNGEISDADFIQKAIDFTHKTTSEILTCGKLYNSEETQIRCPKCGKGAIRLFGKIARCSNPECGHGIYRQICGVTLVNREIRNLMSDGETGAIRGFLDVLGKPFTGKVILDDKFQPFVINLQKN